MARGFKTGGRDWQKGKSGGPGAPKMPEEVRQARKLNKVEAERILNKFLNYKLSDLAEFANNANNNVHEMLVARILFEAVKKGDHFKLEWIYSRLFGAVPKTVDVTQNVTTTSLLDRWKDINPEDHIRLIKEIKPGYGSEE